MSLLREQHEGEMAQKLYECRSEPEQLSWIVAHLKAGSLISETSLWLAGIDRPMQLIARARSAFKAEGMTIGKDVKRVRDAAGETHSVLTWRVER